MKIKILIWPMIVILILLCVVYRQKPQQISVSTSLGVNCTQGEVVDHDNTHGGFYGDGTSYTVLKFSDNKVAAKIANSKKWRKLPLTENTTALIYGITKDGNRQYGPYIEGDDYGTPLFPKIEHGYYYFYDRTSGIRDPKDDTYILERASFNFTIAIFDSDTNMLYYAEMDT